MYFDNYFFVWILFVAIWVLFLMITSKHTNLHKATINGYYKQAKWLLEKGVNPDIIKNGGMTPLFYAIQHDEIKIVQLLLDYGANINWGFGEENMFNPLLEAVINNRQEIVELLIDRGVERGIHYFCVTGNISLVSNELTNIPELIYSKYNTNCSLLHLAIIAGNLELIDLLLERGADINDFSDRVGTPLHQAIVRQDLRLVEHFVQLGANLEIYHGRSTPLATAVLTNNKSIVELLITSGSNLNPTGFDVNYPLLSAVVNNFLDIAAILLENGASVNRIDTLSGDTLLHESVLKNNIVMTDLLIHYGANVNVTNYGGSTPLGLSHTRIGHEKIKSLLLQYGATNYGLDD